MSVTRIQFTKMSGSGNDFVVVDNRRGIVKGDPSVFARVVSERRTGVGADGVLLLEKSPAADFRMKYYNADGSYGGFCGNGARCIARYAVVHRIASERLTFESLGYVYEAKVDSHCVRLKMKEPKKERLFIPLRIDGVRLIVHSLDTGAPHAVLFLDENPGLKARDLSSVDVATLGRRIRKHKQFGKNGTNVNFIIVDSDSSLSIRTYERGVEAETLACGTGSVASTLIAHRQRGLQSPVKVIPRSKEPLVVEFEIAGTHFREVFLEGNVDMTFIGELKYDHNSKEIITQ